MACTIASTNREARFNGATGMAKGDRLCRGYARADRRRVCTDQCQSYVLRLRGVADRMYLCRVKLRCCGLGSNKCMRHPARLIRKPADMFAGCTRRTEDNQLHSNSLNIRKDHIESAGGMGPFNRR